MNKNLQMPIGDLSGKETELNVSTPVGMAAALHLDLAIHNFGIQEYMPHSKLTNEHSNNLSPSRMAICTLARSRASA